MKRKACFSFLLLIIGLASGCGGQSIGISLMKGGPAAPGETTDATVLVNFEDHWSGHPADCVFAAPPGQLEVTPVETKIILDRNGDGQVRFVIRVPDNTSAGTVNCVAAVRIPNGPETSLRFEIEVKSK